nr:MAG TPA: PGDYG protein [Caudoviricetes sp.]
MTKYRKKPVVIDAWQLTKENIEAGIPDWIDTEQVSIFGEANAFVEIHTLEGTMQANYGDYIIKGVQGEFYPCKPDIFEQTYEEVEDETHNG